MLHVLHAQARDGEVWIEVLAPVRHPGQPGTTRVLQVPLAAHSAREAAQELLEAAERAEAQLPPDSRQA